MYGGLVAFYNAGVATTTTTPPPGTPQTPAASAGAGPRRGSPAFANLAATFDSLSNRDYRLLFQGNAVTSVGFWMQQVALGWLVLDLTDSPFYLGLASFARSIPMLVVSPFGGVLADRLDRRFLIISTQVSQLVVTGALAVLVFTNAVTVWQVLVASLLMGIAMSAHVPARQALSRDLVGRHRLANAMALYSLSLNTSRILGPSLAGAVMGWAASAAASLLQCLGYLWAVANVLQIRYGAHRPRANAGATVLQNLAEGLRYCYRTRPIFTQLLIAAVPDHLRLPLHELPAGVRPRRLRAWAPRAWGC